MFEIKIESEYKDLDKYQYDDGDIFYLKKDTNKFHNPYAPAVIYTNGKKKYYIEDKLHRLDGPAIIWQDGDEQYYVNDNFIGHSKQEFYSKITSLNTKNINKQDKINILNIKYCLSDRLDNDSLNILKSLLWTK